MAEAKRLGKVGVRERAAACQDGPSRICKPGCGEMAPKWLMCLTPSHHHAVSKVRDTGAVLPDISPQRHERRGLQASRSQETDMAEYIFLMHNDVAGDDDESSWEPYLERLRESGSFEGGSAIGDGICARKGQAAPSITAHLTGYIRVKADNIAQAKSLLAGNPHFEAGGTLEIRELPRTS